ncbi:MAG: hypothetical protein ACOC71_06605, partial [Hyphomicrobiales bacterium]
GCRVTPAWQQILTLAEDDGWTAVYDPTNPDTRTLCDDGGDLFVAEIADGLGNLPALVQATEANQFKLLTGHFGQLDGLEGNGTSTLMASSTFTTHAQPNFDVVVARFGGGATRTMLDSTTDNRQLTGIDGSGNYIMYAGSSLTGPAANTDSHVFGALFNGASSALYEDSSSIMSGDAGSDGRDQCRVGCRDTDGNIWNGDLGVYLHFNGEPSSAVRTRMFDLLHSLTGIAKAV